MGKLTDSILLTLFPQPCAAGEFHPLRLPYGLCEPCHESLEPNLFAPGLEFEVRCPWVYGGCLATTITAAKFQRRSDLAHRMGRLLMTDPTVRAWTEWADAAVPVPLGRQRLRQRGYNQAAVMLTGMGLKPRHFLRRTRDTLPQSELALESRSDNVHDAFAASKKIPARVRRDYPLVCAGDMIVWIPGYQIAHVVRVTDKTETILELELIPTL